MARVSLRHVLAASASLFLLACSAEHTCDDEGQEFILSGLKTRYATDVSLLVEQGVVVGIRGHNDRGLSFVLRAPGGVELGGVGTHDVSAIEGGLVYLECTGRLKPEKCTASSEQAMQLTASAGTVVVEEVGKELRAQFDLAGVRASSSGEEGEAHGCFRAEGASGAAGSAGGSGAGGGS